VKRAGIRYTYIKSQHPNGRNACLHIVRRWWRIFSIDARAGLADRVCDETPPLCANVSMSRCNLVTRFTLFQWGVGGMYHEALHSVSHGEVHDNLNTIPYPAEVRCEIAPGDTIRKHLLAENAQLENWQLGYLTLLWCRRNKYNTHLLDCAADAGNSVLASGAIVARTYHVSYPTNRALLAVPYRNFAIERSS
jgi:hypothetical protein